MLATAGGLVISEYTTGTLASFFPLRTHTKRGDCTSHTQADPAIPSSKAPLAPYISLGPEMQHWMDERYFTQNKTLPLNTSHLSTTHRPQWAPRLHFSHFPFPVHYCLKLLSKKASQPRCSLLSCQNTAHTSVSALLSHPWSQV